MPLPRHQTSLSPATQVSREQIAEDLAQLAKISDCVRTYATDLGLDQIPEVAAKVGLKVIQGIWLDRDRKKNLTQYRRAYASPGNIRAPSPRSLSARGLVSGEMTASDLAANDPFGQGPGRRPRDLCRCLGVLGCAAARFTMQSIRHHSYPAILGGFSGPGGICRRSRRCYPPADGVSISGQGNPDRRNRLAERGADARVSATVAHQSGPVVSEILDLARRENFRVNLFEAYDEL